MRGTQILDAHDCVLVIVDFQQTFIDKIDDAQGKLLLGKARWLIEAARYLCIPILACFEDGRYPVVAHSLQETVGDAPAFRKTSFSIAREKPFIDALATTGRRSVVLIGFETDVCIAQSALELSDLQYRVAVVEDVVHAPGDGHNQGLERIVRAGITVLSLRALYYEWMADVVTERAFRHECSDLYGKRVIDY